MRTLPPHDTGLPFSSELNIPALLRLFENTTNSYKFVFFLSYLDIIKRREFNADEPIHFRELVVEMLANSWFPHTYFKLSFGVQDLITSKLDSLNLEISEQILQFKDPNKKLLRKTICEQSFDETLMRYVPFRILRPFFDEELRGLADQSVNSAIVTLARETAERRRPLYSFVVSGDAIVPDEAWVEYLRSNYAIVRGWAAWNWLEYMQRCNPAVPAVSSKLFPPQQRDSLVAQTQYWQMVAQHCQVRCLYSSKLVSAESICLDHFLPWSFVAHDQLWNLIPTLAEVNSSKSNSLPAMSYLDSFVALQHLGLTITSKNLSSQKWQKLVEPFFADLRMNEMSELLDSRRLKRAYEATLKPQLELAKTLGFAAGWIYRNDNVDIT